MYRSDQAGGRAAATSMNGGALHPGSEMLGVVGNSYGQERRWSLAAGRTRAPLRRRDDNRLSLAFGDLGA